jgi:hypothetical protein
LKTIEVILFNKLEPGESKTTSLSRKEESRRDSRKDRADFACLAHADMMLHFLHCNEPRRIQTTH